MRLVRTCDACPTQYDVFLEDGRYVYFRYRHGRLSLELFANKDSHVLGGALASVGEDWREERGVHDGFLDEDEAEELIRRHVPELLASAEVP